VQAVIIIWNWRIIFKRRNDQLPNGK